MTKAELIARIAEASFTDKTTVTEVFEASLDQIKAAVTEGHTIYLRGFATVGPKRRAEKKARNITTGEPVIIPAHNVPHFKPSREFRAMVARAGGRRK